MALLDEILAAHGGLARWRQIRRFTAHMSIGGRMLERHRQGTALKDVVMEGSTSRPSLAVTGLGAPETRGVFEPGRVAIETLGGAALAEMRDPEWAALSPDADAPWDNLRVAFYCGLTNWLYLMGPFVLTRAGVEIRELGDWEEKGEIWRRLHVRLPPNLMTHASEWTFYFDAKGFQRRADVHGCCVCGGPVVIHSWAHQSFSGITLPTLRRAQRLDRAASHDRAHACVNAEIFDAKFD